MAILELVHQSHPNLHKKTKKISEFDDSLQTIINDMFETMYHVNGAGLAANQVGLDLCLAVIDVSEEKTDPIIIVNPEIIESSGEQNMEMGCLSLPGYSAAVKRANFVKVKAQDRHGNFFETEGKDLLAEAFQHEIDHLNGILFIDRLSPLKREMVRKKALKTLKKESK